MIRTEVKFEAAHRQWGDPGKCGKLHGHNWKVEVEIDGVVGPLGYIVDFKEIKDQICQMDHTVMLHCDDPLVEILEQAGQKIYLVGEKNPTCENLADLICHMVMDERFQISHCCITIYENDTSYARVDGQAYDDFEEKGKRIVEVS